MNEFGTESKSSVSVAGNAKGEAQTAVKAYEGATIAELDALSVAAVEVYVNTRRRLTEKGEVIA